MSHVCVCVCVCVCVRVCVHVYGHVVMDDIALPSEYLQQCILSQQQCTLPHCSLPDTQAPPGKKRQLDQIQNLW